MTTREKLHQKIFSNSCVSYDDAEKILLSLGFKITIRGSHHVFRKAGFQQNISLKKRSQLRPYQIKLLQEVLIAHGYKE